MTKRKSSGTLIVIALIFLFNPCVNLIDILPDCIAYFLLILAIGSHSESVPYLKECKEALIKLSIITLAKIPAFLIMYSNLQYGSDIVPLFTLAFTVIELIAIYSALSNGYSSLSYLAQRTDCASVTEPITVFGSRITPEGLRNVSVIFFITKGALNVIPEALLLSREDSALKKRLLEIYPAALIICALAALVAGILWLRMMLKYVKSIQKANDLPSALKMMEKYSDPKLSDSKETLYKLKWSLGILALSSLFIFEISFHSLGGYNILPGFIYGIMIFCALYDYTSNRKLKIAFIVSTVCFTISSILNFALTSRFFRQYEYSDLRFSKYAKADYASIKITSVIQTVFAALLLIIAALITKELIKEHTDVSPSDPSYSESNKRNHRCLIKSSHTLFAFAIIISILKCVNVFLGATVKIIHSDVNPDGIVSSGAPVMNTVIFLVSIVYVIYSFVTVSTLRDEVKYKYEKE